MSAPALDRRKQAALLAFFAVGLASAQDAIVKGMAGAYPAYETVIIRTLVALPILAAWPLVTGTRGGWATPHWPLVVLRGVVLCTAYFAFIMSIAAIPIANAVSIYFVMPFFVAALAGPFLGEHVPGYRWLAIGAAFCGVLFMVQPDKAAFEPATLMALYSALGYAVGQMLGRSLSQKVPPLVIGNIQNAVYLSVALLIFLVVHVTGFHATGHKSLVFLTRPFVMPTLKDFLLLCAMGTFSAIALMAFINAYKMAPASFVAPFEYTAMIWAVTYGLIFFGDFPDIHTWIGMAFVVLAGLYMMWRDNQSMARRVTPADSPPNP